MDMDFEDEPQPQARSGPKKRFRKNKLKIVFDSDERKKFLQGFRKRKQERKEKYIEKLEQDLAKEKKRIKQQTQRAVKKLSSSHSVLPEVKSIIDSIPEKEETYDLGNTLDSITSLDDQMYRNLPTIKEEDEEEESEDEEFSSTRSQKKNFLLTDDENETDDDEIKRVAKTDPFFNPINDDEVNQSDESSEDERDIKYDPLAMLRKNTESTEEPTPEEKGMSKAKLEKEANRMLQQSEPYKKMQKMKQKRSRKFKLFRLQPSEEPSGAASEPSSKSKGGKGKKVKSLLKSKSKPANKKSKRK